jgi:hypothetical protein
MTQPLVSDILFDERKKPATRKVPLASKVCNTYMNQIAIQPVLERKLSEIILKQRATPLFGVREKVFQIRYVVPDKR